MKPDENPMCRDIPLSDFREGMTEPVDPRGNHTGNPSFIIVTSIDNGQVYNPTTGEYMPPKFGNAG